MRLTRKRIMLGRRVARAITLTMLVALGTTVFSASLFSFELRTQAQAAVIQTATSALIQNVSVSNSATTPPAQTPAEVRAQLNAPDAEARVQAACQAGRNGDLEKMPLLISMLGDDTKTQLLRCWDTGRWSPALETFKHPSPGEQAAIALASMGHPALQRLTNELDSANATVRRNAAWAIGELTNMRPGERDGAVPRLISLLGDTDEWVRMAAARALGEVRNESAVPKLIATVSDSDWRVREVVVWALSELKDKRAVSALCAVLLSDARVEVRRGAAEALGEIRSREALPSLKQALNDQAINAKVQWAIDEIEGE